MRGITGVKCGRKGWHQKRCEEDREGSVGSVIGKKGVRMVGGTVGRSVIGKKGVRMVWGSVIGKCHHGPRSPLGCLASGRFQIMGVTSGEN